MIQSLPRRSARNSSRRAQTAIVRRMHFPPDETIEAKDGAHRAPGSRRTQARSRCSTASTAVSPIVKTQSDLRPISSMSAKSMLRRPVLIKAEPFFHPPHESTQGGMQPIPERSGADDNRRRGGAAGPAGVEQNAIDSAHLAAVAIDDALVEHIPHDVHHQPPKISSGMTTIAISAPRIVSVASRPLPSGPLVCRPAYSSSFMSTRNGSTTSGMMTTVNATEMSVTRSGSNPIVAIADGQQKHDRKGRDEAADVAPLLVDSPRPSERLAEHVSGVQRDLDGRAEAADAERQGEQRDGPAAVDRHEHLRGLFVGLDLHVLRAEHDRRRDQAAHRDRAAEPHAEPRGQPVDPQILLGPLLLDRARRIEVQQIRTDRGADNADRRETRSG